MTPEQADPQVLMEDYIARLAVLEQTGVPGWSAEWHDAARLAGDALVAEGRVGLEALRLVLDAPTAPADTKWGAFQSLARSKRPDAIMSLVSVLRATTDNRQRFLWVQGLELAGPAAAPALPELIDLLAEKDYVLPSTVKCTLVSIGPAAVDPLLAVLFVPPMQRRAEAAEALGRIGDPRALEPLQAACRDRWPSMRRAAATALGDLGDPRATATWLHLLDDAKPLVRGSAIRALGRIAGREAIPALTAAAADSTRIPGWEPVSTLAKRAIAQIQGRSGIIP